MIRVDCGGEKKEIKGRGSNCDFDEPMTFREVDVERTKAIVVDLYSAGRWSSPSHVATAKIDLRDVINEKRGREGKIEFEADRKHKGDLFYKIKAKFVGG